MLPEQKSTCGHIIFIHKYYNKVFDKTVFKSLKTGQKWNFTAFWVALSQFIFDLTIHICLLWISSSGKRWQKLSKYKQIWATIVA